MICATENSAVIDHEIYDEVKADLKANRVYFVPQNEHAKLRKVMFNEQTGGVNGPIAGKSAMQIAEMADIKVPEDTQVLAVEVNAIGKQELLSGEKLSPVLSVYKAMDQQDAFDKCEALLNYGDWATRLPFKPKTWT